MGRVIASRRVKGLVCAAAVGLAVVAAGDAHAERFLIDFGSTGTQSPTTGNPIWNNVTSANDVSGSPHVVLSTGGLDRGYRLTVTNPPGVTFTGGFNADNTNGVNAPANLTGEALARGYPYSATRDSLYGNVLNFNNAVVPAARVLLSGLDPSLTYDLDFFASRIGSNGENRESEYRITGGNGTTSVFLNAAENTGNITGLAGVTPDSNNQITIDIDPGPNNTNANGFYYLGVLEINSVLPEPGALSLLALGGLALRRRRRA